MNDTIHGYISVPPYVKKIVDTPIFQRLTYIKQLTSAFYVFPGATHTRKEHSLGVMHLSNKYAKHIFDDEYEIKIFTIAGLLHDTMHGPWSHAWDFTIYAEIYPHCEKGHDIHRYRLVRELLKSELSEIGVDPEDIINIWNGKYKVMATIIKGPLSIDRMDFINRDTYYTGTRHFGLFEIDRIIHNTSVYKGSIAYSEKIVPDIIQALTSRTYMYRQVYLHKTVVAASVLIELMIKEAKDTLNLVEMTVDLDKFIYLTDEYLFNQILHSNSEELSKAKMYATCLYFRILPKMINEEIIYVKDDNFHISSTYIDKNGDIICTSRILSNDFESDLDLYDIHVKRSVNGSDNYIPFSKYYRNNYLVKKSVKYYIKRIYRLKSHSSLKQLKQNI